MKKTWKEYCTDIHFSMMAVNMHNKEQINILSIAIILYQCCTTKIAYVHVCSSSLHIFMIFVLFLNDLREKKPGARAYYTKKEKLTHRRVAFRLWSWLVIKISLMFI